MVVVIVSHLPHHAVRGNGAIGLVHRLGQEQLVAVSVGPGSVRCLFLQGHEQGRSTVRLSLYQAVGQVEFRRQLLPSTGAGEHEQREDHHEQEQAPHADCREFTF